VLFNSLSFLIFLPLVLLLYYRLTQRWQNRWLLGASYVFYGWWDYRFLSLILLSTVVDYLAGLAIHRTSDARRRRGFLTLSLVVNLGLLAMFKYFGFFVDSAAGLLGTFGLNPNFPLLHVVLPVGISFYTFQTLSYTIDIYRRQLTPTRDFLNFALFVSYFPQLVAGPIERARHLLPLIEAPRKVAWPAIGIGVELILIGFAKKVGIADAIAPLVDLRFDNPAEASGSELLLAAYLFSIQIYCDFSGYTDIARGVSKLFGIDLMRNFEQPYLSGSITEFWRRWHISLSSWLRDYLYIPLGGNRGGSFLTNRNLMLTMLLGGLWHGASWTFVVWGALHGIYLIGHKVITNRRAPGAPAPGLLRQALHVVITFNLVTLTWVFFRSADFGMAWTFLDGVFTWRPSPGSWAPLPWTSVKVVVCAAAILFLDGMQRRTLRHAPFLDYAWPVRGVVYAALVLLALGMGGLGGGTPFIYFQF
jgi:D-alanyl-lipoteichoic acid acyltransferase DltB (MBOAT superfamily)